MRYKVVLHKHVIKTLEKAPLHLKRRFVEKIEIMKENPFDTRCDILKLQNTDNDYRLRIGEYRFLFTIIDQDIMIYFFDGGSR
jgi:mRNA interferase RelE/StbE